MGQRLKWFLANKYVHLQVFYGPSVASEAVPRGLRLRMTSRLEAAVRLARWRGIFFVLLYAGALGTVVTTIMAALAEATGSEALQELGRLAELLIVVAPIVALVALVAVALLSRGLALLEADIQALGAEVVGRNLRSKEGVLPSAQHLRDR